MATAGSIGIEIGARLEEDSAGRPVLLVSGTTLPDHEELLAAAVVTPEGAG